ncbi:glycoside hydrolase family 88 protein [Alteromonas sp. A081]|uniref:glycoside hydrolase family 88 protein n=1 Tax=Alteromonas sp. A081 TaxID=3410269 RepID=UPI003B982061
MNIKEILLSYEIRLRRKILGKKPPNQLIESVTNKACFNLRNVVPFVSGQKVSGRYHKFSWPYGVLSKGLCLVKTEWSSNVQLTLAKYCDDFSDSGLNITSVEECMVGETILHMAELHQNRKWATAADRVANYLDSEFKKTPHAISYLGNQEALCFIDSVMMICPFLIKYGVANQKERFIEFGLRQLSDFLTYGMDINSNLPFHGYNPSKNNIPVGLVGWGRGTGWLVIGLLDSTLALPKDHAWRSQGLEHIERLANTISRYQIESGGWESLLNRSGTYDTSATIFLSYFILKAVRANVLPISYAKNIKKSVDSLKECIWKDGTVDLAQGNCISMTHMSNTFSPQPFVQSMAAVVFELQESLTSITA